MTGRIRTTHTGSLPRVALIEELLLAREANVGLDAEKFEAAASEAVRSVVEQQLAVGLDIVNDGEQHKPSYATYVVDRIGGFGSSRRPNFPKRRDSMDFPRWAKAASPRGLANLRVPTCTHDLHWRDFDAVTTDLARLAGALSSTFAAEPTGHPGVEGFMTSASPGTIAMMLPNEHYLDDESYLRALGAVMRREYEAIVDAGFILQLDCPDLAAGYNSEFSDLDLVAFLDVAAMHVDVLNEATASIAPSRMRMHVCWGNYEGPHNHDVPLADLLPVLLAARPGALSFEAANPRHAHEWVVWQGLDLPAGKLLIPGVLDTTTNYIEHPALVAERLVRYARIVGPERIIGGADCGFGTMVGLAGVHPDIAWAKLGSLVEGARLASVQLGMSTERER
jgi:5-methyltetrahydropteroyltriglutamate--homocysteine methyltransferase